MKHTTINNSTIKGTFKVIACNAGTLDGSGLDYITIVQQCTCPQCGCVWLRTFKYTSAMENADMYPYDSEPYEELRAIECYCSDCIDAAMRDTYTYEPEENRYQIVYDYHNYDFTTDTSYVTLGITEHYTDHSDAINRLAELRDDPNAEHIEIIDTDFDLV